MDKHLLSFLRINFDHNQGDIATSHVEKRFKLHECPGNDHYDDAFETVM